MKRFSAQLACSILTLMLSTAAFAAELTRSGFERIGTFDFPTTASAEAQEHFLRGVGFLHSFGMTQAQREFRLAQELEPDFALAYWGEAFTYQHPFFGAIDPGPEETMLRLGPTSEIRMSKAANDKERGFIKAAEAYAMTPGGMPERRLAWMAAMADLYEKYPEDDEVKAFYAASMLSGATASGAMRERINMQAGALAMELYRSNDNHPGAAHYIIHAFDDPIHAPIALEAAFKYADIAPAVSHARHMPTHIFIQHGKWQEVAQWNESAFQVARELWQPGDAVGEQNHANDWGQYGDLQLGDLERSKLWIERAAQTLRENPDDGRSSNTLKTVMARHIIESEEWQVQPLTDDLSGDQLVALGLSAAKLGDAELTGKVANRLGELLHASPNSRTLKIGQRQIAALSLLSDKSANNQDEALKLLHEAVEIEENGPLPRGAANPLKPAHEMAGEVYLQLGKAEKAAELYEQSLLRMPNRPRALLGAARSYDHAGETAKAAEKYQALLLVWNDDKNAAVKEAKYFLAQQ